jgi:translation initiation factor 4G
MLIDIAGKAGCTISQTVTMVKTRDQILGFGSCGCVYLIALSLFLSYPQADLFYQSKWPGHLIPQHQPPPSHHPSGTGTPSVALPMSPQNPPAPVQLQQVPGNPTQSHTILTMHHLPHLSVPHQSPSATSPHPTPSTAKRPTSFVPREKITIKNPSGQEINLDALKRAPPPVLPPSPESSKKDVERPIRIESQEQKERRLTAEERSSDSFVKANEDAARRQMEVWEHRKAEKRKSKEEAARAEKGRKETEEQATREERERKEAEEAEAAEQRRKAEEEALKTAEAAEATRALADTDAKPDSLPEEGEIMDEVSQPTTTEEILPSKRASVSPSPAPIPTDLSAKSSEKEPLRICTSIPSLPSPEHQRIRPRPLNLQTAITSNTSPPLPSTLATAWYIEDIKRITYPEGIKSPNVELNVNAQRGKFRCVLFAIDIPFGLNNFTF